MQTILIDTDIAIDFLRGKNFAKELIIPLWENHSAYLSLLSVYELYAGMLDKELAATKSFIGACQIEILNFEICQLGGGFYRDYRKQGITLTSVDCLIYATAKVRHHLIASRNIRHYPDKEILFTLGSQ
ncbi:type II toxin-antitoxin system VapC family toxin [soil metagenome]